MTDPLASERDVLLSTDSSARRFLRTLGPGLVTGAADDDPSGIGTHSQLGAQFGYGLAWTFVLSLPLRVATQQIAAEIGRVTGAGIARKWRRHSLSPVLWTLVPLLCLDNIFTLGRRKHGRAAGRERGCKIV